MSESTEDYINRFEQEMKKKFTKEIAENFADFVSSFYYKAKDNGLPIEVATTLASVIIKEVITGNYMKKK